MKGSYMEFFDSHAHYNDEQFDLDREEIIQQTYAENITKWICAGYDISSSEKSIQIAHAHEPIYAICGISPNDVPKKKEDIDAQIKKIEDLLDETKVVAVGEIGLDYYWNKDNKAIQIEMFQKQIALANQKQLPIVIHTREAVEDTLTLLKTHKVNKKGVFHCCPFNRELVKEALKLDFYISFAGPVTFKNAKNAEEIVKMVPLERMLIETDSPYLAPEPKRGTRNDSRNVKWIAQKIADFKQIPIEKIASKTYQNAKCIFEIP